mmetsp:Transcript_127141/g.283420  ORF Transcript_127141/g.283420 Transcript_127141/m.283420 type:complete len:216 (+) Transcript_127141:116-763(+)
MGVQHSRLAGPVEALRPFWTCCGSAPMESQRCDRFVAWVVSSGLEVVVFDMDHTMSGMHCGSGLPIDQCHTYIEATSADFAEAARALHRIPGLHLAVATGSDPCEYDIEGQSRETHILGPDLAEAVIRYHCPEALPGFEIMVGYDWRLHGERSEEKGKRYHMQKIAAHYGVAFSRMLLIDDTPSNLENEDGWHGVLVRDASKGFRFEDCLFNNSL